ncbi:hypothetical protein LTR50_001650 [Elasticomyces elasticus]|nr:hypothetical protein LTR50_001650 [Elasticomyces elasticus]
MPFRTRTNPKQPTFHINDDPARLDQAYRNMLGRDGDQLFSEEVKWLAVTHKSFDQGRRGFNDRLAYLGRRIVEMQCSLALLDAPKPHLEDTSQLLAEQDPALEGLNNITRFAKAQTLDKRRLSELAQQYGIGGVVRWQPRKVENLQSSGIDLVLAHTIYAIVGAVSLQKGGDVARQIVRERILQPLGLR